MRLLASPSPLATLLFFTSGATLSHAMAAWFTDFGPQVILQNDTTGAIHYTTCNSDGQPTYSVDNVFKLVEYPPKKNTALTGSGYYDSEKTVASIYYLDKYDVVVNAVFNCNMTTGLFELDGNWVISGVAPLPLSPNSGLATVLLGNTAGYRVYYHDENMAINELAYKPEGDWRHTAVISQDPQYSSAIAAAFDGNENITVVTARDTENIEVTRYHADTTWRISTFPHPLQGNLITQDTGAENITINSTVQANFTLPSWNGKPRSMGISIDPKHTRSVWYIGEDKNLYQISNKNGIWSHQNSQVGDIWPVADSPNSPLAVVGDFNNGNLRIYYQVNGSIAEVKSENGEWAKWTTLPAPAPVKAELPAPPPASPSNSPIPTPDETDMAGLSNGAKVGLGVGIALGVLLVIGLIIACVLHRRKQKARASAPSFENGGVQVSAYEPIHSSSSVSPLHSSYGQPSPNSMAGYPVVANYDHYAAWEKQNYLGGVPPPNTAGIYQLDATGRLVELDSPRQVFEMSDQPYAHELPVVGVQYQHQVSQPTYDGNNKQQQ
ncbi:hypothetical protein V8F06_007264 [Rhypophila decipiens]